MSNRDHEQKANQPAVQSPGKDDVHEQREQGQAAPGIIGGRPGAPSTPVTPKTGSEDHGLKKP